jgi:hypothetical protein
MLRQTIDNSQTELIDPTCGCEGRTHGRDRNVDLLQDCTGGRPVRSAASQQTGRRLPPASLIQCGMGAFAGKGITIFR